MIKHWPSYPLLFNFTPNAEFESRNGLPEQHEDFLAQIYVILAVYLAA
jgi:hypothetical protein